MNMDAQTVEIAHFASDGSGNNLLRALRTDDVALLQPQLRDWEAKRGVVLYEPGDNVDWVYFPCGSSLISFLVVLEDGQAVETALIGREGAVGGIVSQGRLPAYARAQVQFGGQFLRIRSVDLEQAKLRSLTLRHLFARYADCVMAQVFQAVACNATHSIEQRTAKWLKAAMDRTGDHEVPLTQEQLAEMLGVGRSYISRILRHLRKRGFLETKRGRMRVTDVVALEGLACGCNYSVLTHFEEVLCGIYPIEEENTAAQRSALAS
jgi:CRP-like cAMP-binding protein